MFSQASVILFMGGSGRHPPWADIPPWAGIPPPWAGIPPPWADIPLPVQTQPPQPDGYCSGRFTSYWNAFLFDIFQGQFKSCPNMLKDIVLWGLF